MLLRQAQSACLGCIARGSPHSASECTHLAASHHWASGQWSGTALYPAARCSSLEHVGPAGPGDLGTVVYMRPIDRNRSDRWLLSREQPSIWWTAGVGVENEGVEDRTVRPDRIFQVSTSSSNGTNNLRWPPPHPLPGNHKSAWITLVPFRFKAEAKCPI